ncbi:MAG: alpha/beta fold hydrolase, partial [Betaproteobacteria bacterium]|nr:alpha/beta fold hydrolase [Betaproteobacteria bacterium]
IVGHSAGAAVAARMVLDGSVQPAALVSLNGAFIRFGGMAGAIFSPLARLMATGSLAAKFFAWQANDPVVIQRLMNSTGSVIDATGMRLYQRLMQSPGHVRAALAMMAHWDLDALERELPKLSLPVWLVAAENDLTVPPQQAATVAKRLPQAKRVLWPMLGHLAHEESPRQCVDLLLEVIRNVHLSTAGS